MTQTVSKLVEILSAIVFPAEPQGKAIEVKDAVATKAYKQPLPSPLNIGPFTYLEAASLADVTVDELPTEKQLLGWVNSRRSATERNKQQAIAFKAAGIEAPVLSDDEKAYNQAFAAAKKLGHSDKRAALHAQRFVDSLRETASDDENDE